MPQRSMDDEEIGEKLVLYNKKDFFVINLNKNF